MTSRNLIFLWALAYRHHIHVENSVEWCRRTYGAAELIIIIIFFFFERERWLRPFTVKHLKCNAFIFQSVIISLDVSSPL